MIKNDKFEIIDIAGDCFAVPIGEESEKFHGVVALNDAATFLLKNIEDSVNESDLISKLVSEFDVDESTAENDVKEFVSKMIDMGIFVE